jgi:hypothetical protein
MVKKDTVYYVESISLGIVNPFSQRETPNGYTVIELPSDSIKLNELKDLDAKINKANYPSNEYTNLDSRRDAILQGLRENCFSEYHFSSGTTHIRGEILKERPPNAQLLKGRKKQIVK